MIVDEVLEASQAAAVVESKVVDVVEVADVRTQVGARSGGEAERVLQQRAAREHRHAKRTGEGQRARHVAA